MRNLYFSEKFISLRKKMGFRSQVSLAKVLNCQHSTVQNWERGHEPQAKWRPILRQVLGPEFDQCFVESDIMRDSAVIYNQPAEDQIEVPVFRSAKNLRKTIESKESSGKQPVHKNAIKGDIDLNKLFIIQISSDTYGAGFECNTFVLFEMCSRFENGDIVVIDTKHEGDPYLYKFWDFQLLPLGNYSPIRVPEEKIIGRVYMTYRPVYYRRGVSK